MKIMKLAAITAIVIVAGSAFAQGGGGRQRGGGNNNGPLGLIAREEVQKELAITEDQKTKITELRASVRTKSQEAMQAAGQDRAARTEAGRKVNEEAAKSLAEILTPGQAKRLREIQIQWSGIGLVATDKELQTALGLTDDQKAKVEDLKKRADTANSELQAKVRSQEIDRAQANELRQKNQKALDEEIGKVLTDTQKTKLTELGGKHLDKPVPAQRGGGI